MSYQTRTRAEKMSRTTQQVAFIKALQKPTSVMPQTIAAIQTVKTQMQETQAPVNKK